MKWLAALKEWWWLATVVGGALILWGSLPDRVKKVEAGQASQQEDIVDLKGVAGKLDGYIAAQQQMNQRLIQQQTPNAPLSTRNEPPRPAWRFQEQDDDGTTWCCDERTTEACWKQDAEGRNGWERCE